MEQTPVRTREFRAALRKCRISRQATLTVFSLGPLLAIPAIALSQFLFFLLVFMLWLPALAVALLCQVSMLCPRCGRPFFRLPSPTRPTWGRSVDFLARSCVQCRMPLTSRRTIG